MATLDSFPRTGATGSPSGRLPFRLGVRWDTAQFAVSPLPTPCCCVSGWASVAPSRPFQSPHFSSYTTVDLFTPINRRLCSVPSPPVMPLLPGLFSNDCETLARRTPRQDLSTLQAILLRTIARFSTGTISSTSIGATEHQAQLCASLSERGALRVLRTRPPATTKGVAAPISEATVSPCAFPPLTCTRQSIFVCLPVVASLGGRFLSLVTLLGVTFFECLVRWGNSPWGRPSHDFSVRSSNTTLCSC